MEEAIYEYAMEEVDKAQEDCVFISFLLGPEIFFHMGCVKMSD